MHVGMALEGCTWVVGSVRCCESADAVILGTCVKEVTVRWCSKSSMVSSHGWWVWPRSRGMIPSRNHGHGSMANADRLADP